MSPSPSSSVVAARRALACRLVEIRKDAGITGNELAARCSWHPSKTSRIQSGQTTPSEADIRIWCAACGAEGQIPDLIAASRAVDSMYVEWKRGHRDGMRHAQEKVSGEYERTELSRVYVSNVFPGFFQTADYARALLRSITDFQGTPDDVEEAAAARVDRARFLHQGRHRYVVLMEECVLRYLIGSEEIMAGQLGHLLTLMPLPSVSVGIIPFTARRGIWPLEAFYLFDNQRVAVETLTARLTVLQPGELTDYGHAFSELAKLAVHGARARGLISAAIDALG
ncbi:helix-turn-helix domain-containing protein [Streptacidiphilus cavernicola]|uniref:Helix-turn-helix domain-containing protein n=1 Tax=Streptacidiphilus cavernicola TaxID=3342716 RepID=A0ABV6W4U7_9ACTN